LANDFLNGGADRPEVTRIDRNQLYDTMGGCAYWTEKHYITKGMLLRHLMINSDLPCLQGILLITLHQCIQ